MFRIHNYVRVLLLALIASFAQAQETLTWDEIRQRFEQNNPTLQAGKLTIDESKAQEITAFLRPNPNLGLWWMELRSPPIKVSGSLLREHLNLPASPN